MTHPLAAMGEPMLALYDRDPDRALVIFDRYAESADPWVKAAVPLQRAAFDTMFGLSRYQGIPAKFSPPEAATGRDSGQPARASQPARQRQASPSTASQPAPGQPCAYPPLRGQSGPATASSQPARASSQPEPARAIRVRTRARARRGHAHRALRAHARAGGTGQPARASPSTAAGQGQPEHSSRPGQPEPAPASHAEIRQAATADWQAAPARASPGMPGIERVVVPARDRREARPKDEQWQPNRMNF